VNDVGEATFEEIDDARSGRNLGWPTTEGPFNPVTFPLFTNPVYTYRHSSGTPTGCAITGGAFYTAATPTFPASYVGKYFFADYCSGWIYYIDPGSPSTATQFAAGISSPVDLKLGPDGNLYYLARGAGSVGKIGPISAGLPQITQQPANRTVSVGATATFMVSATGTAPLSYQWQKNNVDIPGATSASYSTPAVVLAENGSTYRCRVSNAAGSTTSAAATLTVLNNLAPTATILTPASGSRYSAATTLSFSGAGTDPESGTLPSSALSWRIDFHHDTHTHPAMPDTAGIASGTFAIPNSGETSANVWYRVYLTATDSAGLSTTSFVDVMPNTATITLTTMPAGLRLTLDGQPVTAPITVTSVVGIVRTLGVVTPQTAGAITYSFISWSDGGAATHTVATPASNTTYTALYSTPPSIPTGLQVVR
jgi:hypothetical protein